MSRIPLTALKEAQYRLAAARDTLDAATDAIGPHDKHLARQIDLRTHEVDVLLTHVSKLVADQTDDQSPQTNSPSAP